MAVLKDPWSTAIPVPRTPQIAPFTRLASSLAEGRLATIWGPPGAGKTTLAAYVASQRQNVCWLTFDTEYRDFPTLLSLLSMTLLPVEPSAADALLTPGASPAERAVLMLARLRDTIQPVTLILDDVHLVDGVPDIHVFLNECVQHSVPRCLLVMTSRLLPRLDFTRQVNGAWQNAGHTDLLVDPADIPLSSDVPQAAVSEAMVRDQAGGHLLASLLLRGVPGIVDAGGPPASYERIINRSLRRLWDQLGRPVRAELAALAVNRYAPDPIATNLVPAEWNTILQSSEGARAYEMHPLLRQFVARKRRLRLPQAPLHNP